MYGFIDQLGPEAEDKVYGKPELCQKAFVSLGRLFKQFTPCFWHFSRGGLIYFLPVDAFNYFRQSYQSLISPNAQVPECL